MNKEQDPKQIRNNAIFYYLRTLRELTDKAEELKQRHEVCQKLVENFDKIIAEATPPMSFMTTNNLANDFGTYNESVEQIFKRWDELHNN